MLKVDKINKNLYVVNVMLPDDGQEPKHVGAELM
jgi:hypothetical protein